MSSFPQRGVSRPFPCTVCGSTRRCSYRSDGLVLCRYKHGPQDGFLDLGPAPGDPQWNRYRLAGPQPAPVPPASTPAVDWPRQAEHYAALLSPERRQQLADHLDLPPAALEGLAQIGYDPAEDCWLFPERNG